MSDEPCDPDSDNPADWSLQHHPDRPYLNGEPIRTGDRVAFVDIDGGRTEGIAHVDSAIEWNRDVGHATRVAIIPDGEPWKYGRDYAFASAAADADLTFTAHRWLKGDPIPYDEMRRLCGLDPAVKAYCARRDMQRSFSEIGKAMNQVATDIGKGFERFADALTASKPKPKPTPPMWADDPSRQRRPTKTRNHRRVK